MSFTSIADQIPTLFGTTGQILLAYLDPGSGSMLLQLLIAGLLSGMFLLKSSCVQLRHSVVRVFKRSV